MKTVWNGLLLGWLALALADIGGLAPEARGEPADGVEKPDEWIKGLVLSSPVMDYAGVLGPERKAALENAIRAGTASNGSQLVVVSLASLKGGEIGDFANRLFAQWRIGEKGKDNGVLLLLALEERQVGIEVGYGFEEALPDGRCGRIRDEVILPPFRDGDPAAAMEKGAAALLEVMAGVSFGEREERGNKAAVRLFWVVFAGAVVLIVWSATKRGRQSGTGTATPHAVRSRIPGKARHGRMGSANRGGMRRGGGFHGKGGRSGGGGARGGC